MKHIAKPKRILIAIALIAFLVLPLTIFLVNRPQTNRSSAAEGTALTFDPVSSEDEPIEVLAGDDVALVMQVEPGTGNLITYVKYVVEYDPEIFTVAAQDIVPSDTFSEILEGPTVENGRILGSVSVGSDPTNAVGEPTAIGEILFQAKKSTADSPTTIAFASDSEALSIGENDNTTENILTNTGAAIITVGEGTPAKTPEDDPAANPEEGTSITFSALLHGIGNAGDSANPQNNSLSNKKPLYETRPTIVAILDENGEDVSRTEGELLYDEKTGKFAGSFTLDAFIPEGPYSALILSDGYLPFEKAIEITNTATLDLGEISLVAGDIVPDGTLDILDYNALSDCGYGSGNPLPMDNPESAYQSETCQQNEYAIYADLDDNGIIDSHDFNLFLRELSAQSKGN